MSRYKWVWHHDGTTRLYEVGIMPDGSLYNPRGYPEDDVRSAVVCTENAIRVYRMMESARLAQWLR